MSHSYRLSIIVPFGNKPQEEAIRLARFYKDFSEEFSDLYQVIIPCNAGERTFNILDDILKASTVQCFEVDHCNLPSINKKLWNIYHSLKFCKTNYVCIFDNDIIPESYVLEKIRNNLKKYDFVRTMVNYDDPDLYDLMDISGILVMNKLSKRKQYWGNIAFKKDIILEKSFPRKDGLFDELILETFCELKGGSKYYQEC